MIMSNSDKLLINSLIKEAESKTKAEIVPMIVHHSDTYPAAHFRAAIIVSFLFCLGLYFSPFTFINPIYFLWIQIPGLFLGYYLGQFPIVTRALITKYEIEQEVTQKAYEAFFNHNLHLTQHHNGVLILISMMERKVKIIADNGIASKVDQHIWDEILYEFSDKMHAGQFTEGLKHCIEAVSNVLQVHFPSTGTEKNNELKNDLIEE